MSSARTADNRHDDCELVSRYAEAVMGARQNNADMAEVMRIAIEGSDDGRAWKQDMVRRAYDAPRFETQQNRANATRDFKNEAYAACLKSGV